MTTTRTEKDFLGTKDIPADAYYGVYTARAIRILADRCIAGITPNIDHCQSIWMRRSRWSPC